MEDNQLIVKPGALSQDERAFVANFIRTRDQLAAYKAAGFMAEDEGELLRRANVMLNTKKVAAEIARLDAEVLVRVQRANGITLDRTLREIAATAFYDVRKLFNEDGSPKNITELDDETAAAIEGIDVLEVFEGSGKEKVFVGTVKKYRLAKRTAGLDMLMKHLNGYKASNDSKAEGAVNALVSLLGAMRRSALPVVHQVSDDSGQ